MGIERCAGGWGQAVLARGRIRAEGGGLPAKAEGRQPRSRSRSLAPRMALVRSASGDLAAEPSGDLLREYGAANIAAARAGGAGDGDAGGAAAAMLAPAGSVGAVGRRGGTAGAVARGALLVANPKAHPPHTRSH